MQYNPRNFFRVVVHGTFGIGFGVASESVVGGGSSRITSYNVCYTKLLRFFFYFREFHINEEFSCNIIPMC